MVGTIQGKQWGTTSCLFHSASTEVNLIHANAGGFCSRHCHRSKFNRFVVLSGCLEITIFRQYVDGDEEMADKTILRAGMASDVPPGVDHMFRVLEPTEALEIYWVSLEPNDIIRVSTGGMQNIPSIS